MSRRLSEYRIVRELAEHVAKCISRKVIRQLQGLKDLQSGDDSGLKNVWDEICVQVQYEQSILWDAYDTTVRSFVADYLNQLPDYEREALWLQTNEGQAWTPDDEEIDEYPVLDGDLIDYLSNKYIYAEAEDWRNSRIERYLDGQTEFDFS